ncbi:B12-binding domain-containing radical SAM protein [Mariniblastus fucicola]|uniref:Biotin synthase n=1 Tax=Mariniblastus fucicola TaxID=980251 RepID=A0A5B9PCP6_9BACT|nr:radical SAM protein [Mariniblastus fucicola]QEG23279.1 biotin synthase [Mariniblastus fucicola]
MNVVLWDTRRNNAQKDFAGGMGVGMHPGTGGIRGKIIRQMYLRDYRPTPLNFAYLIAVIKQLGHTPIYSLDQPQPPTADVYIFNPALVTLDIELETIKSVRSRNPLARIFVVGQVAFALAESLAESLLEQNVTILKGEPEQLLTRWDDVMQSTDSIIDIGSVSDLNTLPNPDWSQFQYKRFRINYDFWRFPTAYIQQSRGCTFKCNYCPYIMIESKTRFRDPEAVVEEMRFGMERYGFESFKFRDPLFGLNRKKALTLAEGIRKLPRKIQFSIETRVDLMREETLRELKDAGLTAITIGIETPDEATLKRYSRVAINDDRQRDFVALCRKLGIRTVAGFMVGFPGDTRQSIWDVLNYARLVNPTYANFNIVTPYPGTEFYNEVEDQIEDHDFSKYSVYQPVMKYENLTSAEVAEMHGKCFEKFYFRARYVKQNGLLLWPQLRRFLPKSFSAVPPQSGESAGSVAKAA